MLTWHKSHISTPKENKHPPNGLENKNIHVEKIVWEWVEEKTYRYSAEEKFFQILEKEKRNNLPMQAYFYAKKFKINFGRKTYARLFLTL